MGGVTRSQMLSPGFISAINFLKMFLFTEVYSSYGTILLF